MSRRIVLFVVAAAAVIAGVAGWALGRQIESPAEAAARVAAPPASLISVPVELRELSSAVVTRGTIEFDQTTGIEIAGSETGSSIITRLTKNEGDDLIEGDVVIEVAGRPLFVLEGELPVFRSLTPGLEGPDVLQLEEALERLGLDPGPVDGLYGSRTEAAIEELYKRGGYRPPAVDLGDQATIDGARDRVEAAEKSVANASDSGDTAAVPRSTRLELDRFVANSQAAFDEVKAQRDGAVAGLAADRDAGIVEAASLEETLIVARQRHEMAFREGIHPDTGLAPTVTELEDLRLVRKGAKQAWDAALVAVGDATTAHDNEAQTWARQIEDARVDLQIAAAQRSETLNPPDNGDDGDFLAQAQEDLSDAKEDLLSLEREIGTRLPASELVFLPSLPRLVQRVSVGVGDFPQGAVMQVTGNELAVVSGVTAADRSLLEVGQVGTLDDPNEGITVEATIDFIADNPGGPDLGSDRYRIRLLPIGDVPEEVFNENLRLRIPISSTGGEVLSVPLAALSAAADGTSRVEKLIDEDTTDIVEVSVGLSSGGFVQVEALDGTSLSVGDRVIVGRDQPDEVEPASEVEPADDADEG